MDWDRLLSTQRLCEPKKSAVQQGRSSFHRDFDRVIFSSAFRRLQDKAQVFPLAKSDYVRTRLTHSLESASIGRSLGRIAAEKLRQRGDGLPADVTADDVASIVAAACLAHDIGNPPFGHAGERAIAEWFARTEQGQETTKAIRDEDPAQGGAKALDLERFEGNAQGFRLLTRLQYGGRDGGLRLTHATLGAFTKYPCRSSAVTPANGRYRKHGLMAADWGNFERLAQETKLARATDDVYARHPLAFLVEAADDICYHVVDIEDGAKLGLVDEGTATKLMRGVIMDPEETKATKFRGGRRPGLELVRAKAINSLVHQVASVFVESCGELLGGAEVRPITESIPRAAELKQLKLTARRKLYSSNDVLLIEAAGFTVLGALLDRFIPVVEDVARKGKKASTRSLTLFRLIPPQFVGTVNGPRKMSRYERTLAVTDYVSGMTDRYAVALYKQLTGISLPGE